MSYFESALLLAVLAGALGGLIGVVVVLRERAFFTTALSHTTFPGAVAAALLGIAPVAGAAVAAVVLVLCTSGIGRLRVQTSAVASGIMLTAGFALGALLQSLSPTQVDVESFLTGSLLAATPGQFAVTGVALAIAAVTLVIGGRDLIFATFDAEGHSVTGGRPVVAEAVTLGLCGLGAVVLMPFVGAILAVALLVAPAVAARFVTRTTTGMLVAAPLIGAGGAALGVVASRALALPVGASVTLVLTAAVLLALPIRSLRHRLHRPHSLECPPTAA